jgi:hypothetical protein
VRARAFETVVLGGLTAGVLDILDAFLLATLNGGSPIRVLQAVASGIFGRAAYEGGMAAATIGLALHFVIAFGAAATFFVATRRWTALLGRPVLSGITFGLAVWAFMYSIVLPITFMRMPTVAPWPQLANQLAIHMFGVGLPIALFASRSAGVVSRRAQHHLGRR